MSNANEIEWDNRTTGKYLTYSAEENKSSKITPEKQMQPFKFPDGNGFMTQVAARTNIAIEMERWAFRGTWTLENDQWEKVGA